MAESPRAHATDFQEIPVYYPAVRPGYAGWANLFDFGNGDLGCVGGQPRARIMPLKPKRLAVRTFRRSVPN